MPPPLSEISNYAPGYGYIVQYFDMTMTKWPYLICLIIDQFWSILLILLVIGQTTHLHVYMTLWH